MAFEDPNDAPKAERTECYKCGHCDNLHVALVDEDGLYIAIAIMSKEMLEGMLKRIDEPPTDENIH